MKSKESSKKNNIPSNRYCSTPDENHCAHPMRRLMYCALCIVHCALFLWYSLCYRSHFYWQEQNQIFLDTRHWVASYFNHPAWLSCLAGDWLTQFYIYPLVGPVVLTLTIAAATALFAVFVSRLLPDVAALILTILFTMLLAGCSFPSATSLAFFLSVAGGLGLGLLKLEFKLKSGRVVSLSPLLVLLSYWMFGFGSMITAFVIVVSSIRSRNWSHAICAIVFALGFPAMLRDKYALPYSKALLYPGIAGPSLPESKFETRLAIADAFYSRDYGKVKTMALNDETPDDFTAFYYYLSSAVQDSLADNLLRYPHRSLGTLTTIGKKTPVPVINMMNDLYFELGDMTYAERAAMMRNVFSPRNRNVRMIQRLAEINLISGDTIAARKYLGILGKTHAYSGWAAAHTPGQMEASAENDILRRRANSNSKDNIRIGDNSRNIILELLESNPHNTVALDYLLCTDLLLKDMDTFKMDYDTYCIQKGAPRYKDLYQQALMIYLAGTDAPQEEWDKYIVVSPNVGRFHQYSNRRGDPAFADTYWYFFDKG